MGMGDELLAAGQAARVHRETGRKVAILGSDGVARWHELWQGLDYITPCKASEVETIKNGPGARPYIRYPFTRDGHGYSGWRARDHRPVIAVPREPAEGFVLIEPTLKALANPNKRWARWQEVVDALPGVRFVQCGPAGSTALRGVECRQTATYLDAVRVLAKATAYLGHEGGMHHAAAALDVPAVVVFGGSPSIEATGYPDHTNIGAPDPCGRWSPCEHCAAAMAAITPDAVAGALRKTLETA